MSAVASQITTHSRFFTQLFIQAQVKENIQSSVSLVFVRRIHQWPVNSPHKWPVMRKMFPFDDVNMNLLTLNPTGIEIRIFRGLGNYHGCWCHGSLHRQAIIGHGMDIKGETNIPFLSLYFIVGTWSKMAKYMLSVHAKHVSNIMLPADRVMGGSTPVITILPTFTWSIIVPDPKRLITNKQYLNDADVKCSISIWNIVMRDIILAGGHDALDWLQCILGAGVSGQDVIVFHYSDVIMSAMAS